MRFASKTMQRTMELMQKENSVSAEELPSPCSSVSLPSVSSAQPLENMVSSNPNSARAKVHNAYDYVQKTGLIVTSGKEIRLGKIESTNMNENGSEKIYYSPVRHSPYLMLTAANMLMDRGTMLYYGPPGTGKTTAPEIMGYFLFGIPIQKIQESAIHGNPEISITDMIATLKIGTLLKTGEEVVVPRPFMTSMIRVIDEINRIPPNKLSAAFDVADRGTAFFKGHKIVAPPGPLFATANYADSGTYDIPPPLLDRIDLAVSSDYCSPSRIEQMFMNKSDKMHSNIGQLRRPAPLTANELGLARAQIKNVKFDDDALGKLVYFLQSVNSCYMASRDPATKTKAHCTSVEPGALCSDCHYSTDKNICSYTKNGLSTRTYWAAYTFSKAFSWWTGHNKVSQGDLEEILPYIIYHKLRPTNIALEKDPIYKNDKVALAHDLFTKSCAQYDVVKQHIPIEEIARMVTSVYLRNDYEDVNVKKISGMIGMLKKIDSPVKYAIGADLLDIREMLEKRLKK
jgi:MoxR-like ATPase